MMFSFLIITTLLLGLLFYLYTFKEVNTINLRFLINLSLPIGIGISSVLFIVFNLFGLSTNLIVLIEIALVVFLFYILKTQYKVCYKLEWLDLKKLFLNSILLIITIIYFYALLLDIIIFLAESIEFPHGLWDAWGDWNLGAKFIARDPYGWSKTFHQIISTMFHMDYPLLQKGFIAQCWMVIGNETVWVPIAFCFIFTFCSIGLLSASVSYFTNKTNGLIAGLVMLCSPYFMTMGDSQYADNTIGYFYLATIILLTFARSGIKMKPAFLIAAGISAGLAGWTKNEGLLFILLLFVSQLPLLFYKNYRQLFHELKYILFGMLPILILIGYFKVYIAPPNEIISAQGIETLSKITDYSRHEIAIKWYYHEISKFGDWILNPWWLFLLGILFNGLSIKQNRESIISNLALLLLMLLGCYFVFIIADLELEFYLHTTVHRLYFQLFPSFIFLYFISLNVKRDKA